MYAKKIDTVRKQMSASGLQADIWVLPNAFYVDYTCGKHMLCAWQAAVH